MKTAKKQNSRKTRGISPVISTIIISGTLLVILVIASFVATNLLELQVANTEFEQAKTSMLLLDEVIQDVALRPGSGGYVQFNQRSGGINVIQSTETLRILGPSTKIVSSTLHRYPTKNKLGSWNNPEGAYIPDEIYANSSSHGSQHEFYGFKFEIPESAEIVEVDVSIGAKIDVHPQGGNKPDRIKLEISVNNGTSYISTSYTFDISLLEPIDITGWHNWAITDFNSGNLMVRVTHVAKDSGDKKVDIVYLDYIDIVVTYASEGPEQIYESPNLVTIFYRGGSKVSGADALLRGNASLVVNMTGSLGYLRIETGNGVQIKLDYSRVGVTNYGVQVAGQRLTNVTVITFYRLVQGNMGGLETVNVKIQNMFNTNPIVREYNTNNVTIRIELGSNTYTNTQTLKLFSGDTNVQTTTVIVREIVIQVSTA